MIADDARAERSFDAAGSFLRLVRRHKVLVFGPILLGLVGADLVYMTAPKHYVATAVVALDVRKVTVAPMEMVVSRLPQENPALRTEMDILGSRSMAERVIQRLGAEAVAPLLGNSFSGTPDQRREALVNRLIDGLQISNDGRSYTFDISFSSTDPVFAAKIANSYAQEYFAHQTAVKLTAIRTASEWLGKKVEELRRTLVASEQASEAFKQKAGLLKTSGTGIENHRLEALNTELVHARAIAAAARARFENAIAASRAADGQPAFAEALNSPIILRLREQRDALLRQSQSLQDTGILRGGHSPAIQSELRSLQTQIHEETSRVLESLGGDVKVADSQEKELEDAIQKEITASGAADAATIHLNELQREAAANRSLYESFLNRYKATIEQEDLAGPEAQLISSAQPASRPSTPKLFPLMALGLFLGAATGVGAAFMREHSDDRVWSVATLEERTELPVLGALPSTRWPAVRRLRHRTWLAGGAEELAVQRLRAVLRFSPATRDAKVIAVTSAEGSEGKTFVSIALARAFTAAGESALIVGADLRRPTLGPRLRLRPSFYWEEVMAGEKTIDDIVQQDQDSKVSVIAADPSQIASVELFSAMTFEDLMASARDRYDRIIIDTPPVLASADVAVLGAVSDVTLMVVRWGTTMHTAVVEALRQMSLYSRPVAGIVLNQLDPRASAHYATSLPTATSRDTAATARSAPGWAGRAPRFTTVAGSRDHTISDEGSGRA